MRLWHMTSSPLVPSARASSQSPDCAAPRAGRRWKASSRAGRSARRGREQPALLESFLRSRGNLRDIERELGISYPTVRARVEALVRTLGFGPRADEDAPAADDPQTPNPSGEAILERLARHDISAEDA